MKNQEKFQLAINVVLACIGILSILWVNYLLIGDWFGKSGPANIGSIEVSYISMARFLNDFGFSSWSPFWYFGYPTHVFYTPLLPFLELFLHKVFQMPLWESYRFLTGIGFMFAPVSVFFLGWQLSKKILGGIIAAALFTAGPTVMYFIVPSGEVFADRISLDFLDPRRFTLLVRWGEGPHTFSLIFIPLVGVFFAKFLERPRFFYFFLSSVFLGLSGLTNAVGLFSSVLLVFSMSFVKFCHLKKERYMALLQGIGVGLLGLGLISFWYNIAFISNFFSEGGGITNMLYSIFPWGWVGAIILGFVVYFITSRYLKDFAIASALVWFLTFFIVVATYYLSAPPEDSALRIELLPQALRYNVEVDLSLSVLVGVLSVWLISYIKKRLKFEFPLETIFSLLVIMFLFFYIQPFIAVAKGAGGTSVDIKKIREYEIAMWLDNHTDEKKGERVFLPGNYGFYLNYFTNVWQHRGGLFQASTHYWPEHIHYLLTNGKNADIAKAWLVISNVKYAVITSPASVELYKEIKNPKRFSDFPVVLEEKGDIIYEVPLKRPSLAKPINTVLMATLKVPKKADDKKPLLAYAEWIENSSENKTDIEVENNDTYYIRGRVDSKEAVLVQMTADAGWKAKDNVTGKKVKTGTDPLGFIVLYPKEGNVDITLTHGSTWKQWIGYFITFSTIGFIIFLQFAKKHPSENQLPL